MGRFFMARAFNFRTYPACTATNCEETRRSSHSSPHPDSFPNRCVPGQTHPHAQLWMKSRKHAQPVHQLAQRGNMIALRALCGLYARIAAAKSHGDRTGPSHQRMGPPHSSNITGSLSPQDSMPLKTLPSKISCVPRSQALPDCLQVVVFVGNCVAPPTASLREKRQQSI